jgi:hypothetical protein
MAWMHCLACDGLVDLSEAGGKRTCDCGSSTAVVSDSSISLNGPCQAEWTDGYQRFSATMDTSTWPAGAPRVVRKVVDPLL